MSRCLSVHALLTVLFWILNPSNTEGACPVGHYCPPEGGEIACPRGFYNPTADSTDYTACLPCPAGQFCYYEGASAPQGPCYAGFYCPGRNTLNQPQGRVCWRHHYCPSGTTAPLRCSGTQHQTREAKSSCDPCPVGSFCIDGFLVSTCDYGYYCSADSNTATQNPCGTGHYCADGTENQCAVGSMQPQTSQADCQPCPVGNYCDSPAALSSTGTCTDTWYCEQSEISATPGGNNCPAGYKCENGLKIECGKGYYQPLSGQSVCLVCPVGSYCDLTTTITPTPCAQGQCCQEGFLQLKSCQQGTFLHFTYEEVNRLTWTEAEALCQAQGIYKLAVIDTQEEYYRVIAWFTASTSYADSGNLVLPHSIWVGGVWTAGVYKWDMNFALVTLSWGNWKTGQDPTPAMQSCLVFDPDMRFENVACSSKMDVLCEQSNPCVTSEYYSFATLTCIACDAGKYCARPGMFQTSGTCDDGWYCDGGASTPNQHKCDSGHYCTGGNKFPCAEGTYQALQGSTACLPCTEGKYCNAVGLVHPVGLCQAGYYCPEGSSDPQGSNIPCTIGHSCPTGSGAPTPCPGGKYQDQTGQSFCKMCPEDMYCDTAEAIVEQQSGAGSPTHGVVTPKPCPAHIDCLFGSSSPFFHQWGSERAENLDITAGLMQRLDMISLIGKKGRDVAAILTPEMKRALDILVTSRATVGIDALNRYLFPRSTGDGHIEGHVCLSKLAYDADLKYPERIGSTKLRKYIATVVQMLNLEHGELEWLSNHLGHTIDVHKEFYRNQEGAVQLGKVAKMLIAVDQGRILDNQTDENADGDVSNQNPDEQWLVLDDSSSDDEDDDVSGEASAKKSSESNASLNVPLPKSNYASGRVKVNVKRWTQEEIAALKRQFDYIPS